MKNIRFRFLGALFVSDRPQAAERFYLPENQTAFVRIEKFSKERSMGESKKDKKSKFSIRNLSTKDLDQYNALLRYSFQVTEDELMRTGWRADEIKQSKFPVLERADVLGCFDRKELVSQFAVYPLKMNIYDSACPIGFITSVCTYPEYSGKGIMSNLMHKSLIRMKERGQLLALLYPYSIPLYRKFGWEIISNKISYTVKDRQIPVQAKVSGFVRRVNWENEDFMDLHARFAKQTHGCLYRDKLAWEEYWRWDEDDTAVAVYYDAKEKPLGYMVYLIKDDVMHIKEMIYLNTEAQKGLWEYIRAHDSMIDEVRGNTYFNEPIAFYMNDGDIRETIRPYIMGRIVDVVEFFKKYNCNPNEKGVRIAIEVTDSFLDWNNVKLTVLFKKGKCKIVKDDIARYHVRMSVATLTALLVGYKTALQLFRAERIEGDIDAVRRLDDVILHESPYISDYI